MRKDLLTLIVSVGFGSALGQAVWIYFGLAGCWFLLSLALALLIIDLLVLKDKE